MVEKLIFHNFGSELLVPGKQHWFTFPDGMYSTISFPGLPEDGLYGDKELFIYPDNLHEAMRLASIAKLDIRFSNEIVKGPTPLFILEGDIDGDEFHPTNMTVQSHPSQESEGNLLGDSMGDVGFQTGRWTQARITIYTAMISRRIHDQSNPLQEDLGNEALESILTRELYKGIIKQGKGLLLTGAHPMEYAFTLGAELYPVLARFVDLPTSSLIDKFNELPVPIEIVSVNFALCLMYNLLSKLSKQSDFGIHPDFISTFQIGRLARLYSKMFRKPLFEVRNNDSIDERNLLPPPPSQS